MALVRVAPVLRLCKSMHLSMIHEMAIRAINQSDSRGGVDLELDLAVPHHCFDPATVSFSSSAYPRRRLDGISLGQIINDPLRPEALDLFPLMARADRQDPSS